jgi:hypothetical protein
MSGGFHVNVESVSDGMAVVSLSGAAGAAGASGSASGTTNHQNPLTALLNNTYGYATNGNDGVLRYHEFRGKLSNVFNFNREVGSIFTTKFNAKEMGEFIDELYLSYLIVFIQNPTQLNATNACELNAALFNPQNQYIWFKAYILAPNLKYNGFYGFPVDVGVKSVAEIWLKR